MSDASPSGGRTPLPPGPPPWIVGHRGAAGEALENTLASFAVAVDQGADMVELDVQLAADGALAVVHDFDLARLAGVDIRPEEARWNELERIRLRSADGRDARIPRLDDVFAALPAALPVNVELKRDRAERGRLVAAAARFAERGALFSSFDAALLVELRRRVPAAALAPLAGDDADPGELLALARTLDAAALHVSAELARRHLPALRAGGLPVLCYTVNDSEEARYLLDSGACGLFTDHPGALRRALGLSPGLSIRMPCSSP